jgi:hypothetical protein
VLSLLGEKRNFPSVSSNGIQSIGFNSSFPLSFAFAQPTSFDQSTLAQCSDPRWRLLALSVTFTSFLSIFTASPSILFNSIFASVFFHVAFASDPPDSPELTSLVSTAIGRFLPAAFVGLAIYHFVIRSTLKDLTAQFEKTILWLGGCWVGVLSNITLEMIPIQRLTPHDLKQQPGAITALVCIALLILTIALAQAWCLRIEGRLILYLKFYAVVTTAVLLLLAIPGLELRIHHYILALLLLPGTAIQTRASLLYQGLLLGLFINGVARWGFDSILQTPAMLLQDGRMGSLIPEVMAPVIGVSNITIFFNATRVVRDGFDGVSMLVNDVERYRGFEDGKGLNYTWNRELEAGGLDYYFRFAYVKYSPLGGPIIEDYGKTGIWRGDGTWVAPPPPGVN